MCVCVRVRASNIYEVFQQDYSSSLLLYETKSSKFPFESASEHSDSVDMILVSLSNVSLSSTLSHGSYLSGEFEIRPVCNITSSGKSSSERLYLYKALRCLEASKLVELISLRVSAHITSSEFI